MKITFRYITYLIFLGVIITSLYLMNLFSKKPFSLDHFLAKELIINVLDSPEYMTYLGIFDNYGQVLGLSLIHISEPTRQAESRMPSSA